jgi:hypothetical protein
MKIYGAEYDENIFDIDFFNRDERENAAKEVTKILQDIFEVFYKDEEMKKYFKNKYPKNDGILIKFDSTEEELNEKVWDKKREEREYDQQEVACHPLIDFEAAKTMSPKKYLKDL